MLLIEGVGGIMVPLDERPHRAGLDDGAAHADRLVAGSYVGTISHTLTALEVAGPAQSQRRGDGRQREPEQRRAARRHRG